ncbi:DinB family protein [Niabella beijingensis]|uniref:DinB family protein n=1 Tax=Niabella beijingensis TaxID=2872700 RepID=UPI001CBF27C0|nr:DinB family protein [Niabella beijingensis]MBZ4187526.1 DinB family protein [Niabella beijingensis]
MKRSEYCTAQYGWIKNSREVLLTYLEALKPGELEREFPSFSNGGSIRNLLVHIANVYQHWVGIIALHKEISYAAYGDFKSIDAIRSLYYSIDELITELLKKETLTAHNIPFSLNNVQRTTSFFQIFSHATTHEFHHKGQVLTISRLMGYTPADTDIIH